MLHHWDSSEAITNKHFGAVDHEWARITEEEAGERGGWNIRLKKDGRLKCWLTPFQHLSGKVPRALAEELQSLHKQHPASLVVQKASRNALQRAVMGNIWRVHPEVVTTVEQAITSYNAIRAPFTPLNEVQRLGYLDEEDSILCKAAIGLLGFEAGKRYTLVTETIEGRKIEKRKRVGKSEEEELVCGQELAIILTDAHSQRHCFTQFPPHPREENRPQATYHHLLQDLLANFIIPDVPDVATLDPQRYLEYKRRLLALEAA